MEFGIHFFATAQGPDVREIARLVEELGFDSFFLPEHTHIPASFLRDEPEMAEWADVASELLDPFVALAAVAGVTERLRLGTSVVLVPQRDPIVLAKEVSTLDVLSGGRFLFGVGAGWLEDELRNHGVDPSRRWQRTTEAVLAMKLIWTEEEASFAGEFVRFERVRQGPRPVQKPHPPILVGANGPRALERVLEWGDEWHPGNEPEIEQRVAELHRLTAERGRERIRVSVFAAPQDDQAVERFTDAGIDSCIFAIETGPREELRTKLRVLSKLARRHR